MAEPRRKLIREEIYKLLNGKTSAGENVFSNLSSTWAREELPAIAIYTQSEEIEELNIAPKEYKRKLQLIVEIAADGPEKPSESEKYLEDTLDIIAEEIEEILTRNDRLGKFTDIDGKSRDLIDTLQLLSIDFQYEAEANKPTASCRLVYECVYVEFRPKTRDGQDNIADFTKANVKWNVGPDASAPAEDDESFEAEDDLIIPS